MSTSSHWLVPANGSGDLGSVETVRAWLAESRWGIRSRRPQLPASGDRLSFYAAGVGVIATATAQGLDEAMVEGLPPGVSGIRPVQQLRLSDVVWLSSPIRLTSDLRRSLDAFRSAPPRVVDKGWGYFVFSIHTISERDFDILTGAA